MYKRKLVFSTLCLALLLTIPQASLASPLTNRLSGENRYNTAALVSRTGWSDKSKYAILATGEDFPDALCAAPLAKKYDAPILLITKDSIPTSVKDELTRLKVDQAIIIGGTGVISNKIENTLTTMKINYTRIYGKDRYETSVKIAKQLHSDMEVEDIAITTGENFPDAISISSIAAQKAMPILLTSKNNIPDSIVEYLKGKNIKNTYVIGGNGVISDNVSSKLQNVTRLQGANRYDTNISVLNKFSNDLNFNTLYVATGDNYPDALTASVLSSKTNSPLCLVGDNSSSTKLKNTVLSKKVEDNTNAINLITVIGGTDVVSNDYINILRNTYPSNNTITQCNNIAVNIGDTDYYIKPSSNTTATGGLYKISKTSNSSILLDRDTMDNNLKHVEKKSNINIVNDWIYYENIISDFSKESINQYTEGIYKIKSDGSEKTKICVDNASEIRVSGNSIYYINNSDKGKPYKINSDGTGKTKLSDDENCYNLTVSGNNIYYLKYISPDSPRQLYKANLDGSGSVLVPTDKFIKYMKVDGNCIYFITDSSNESRIYRMNIDGSNKIKLLQAPASNFISSIQVSNGNVYYFDSPTTNSSNYSTLYKISSDGKSTQIKDKLYNTNSIEVVGDKIYLYQQNDIYKMNLDGSNLQILK